MCLAVYIASSSPLSLIEWAEATPSFYVSELSSYESHVRKQFKSPYVYYAGSSEGCGCGFLKDGEAGEELEKVQENYLRLAEFINQARQNRIKIQLYSCWEGDQGSRPEFKETLEENSLRQEWFEFKEKAIYEIADNGV